MKKDDVKTKKTRKAVLIGWLLLGSISLTLAACGPSAEESAATNIAATAAAASPTPTEMPTPTLTPTPSPSATPEINYSEMYYPHEENVVYWYQVLVNGEITGITSFSAIGTERLDDGSKVHLILNIDPTLRNIDYIEFLPNEVNMYRFEGNSIYGIQTNNTFSPPIPMLKFPLEDGKTWEANIEKNGEPTQYSFEVSEIGTVSVPIGDIGDCYKVERTHDGVMDFADYYCPEVGRPAFEMYQEGNTIRLELLFTTSARVDLKNVEETEDYCGLSFVGEGFESDEEVALIVIPPEGERFVSGVNVIDQKIIVYPLYENDVTGQWLFQFDGETNDAYFLFDWTGECPQVVRTE